MAPERPQHILLPVRTGTIVASFAGALLLNFLPWPDLALAPDFVALTLAYLRKSGRLALAPAVYAGTAAGVIASFAAAWLFAQADNKPLWEGLLAALAAAMVISMVVYMQKAARTMRGDIAAKVDSAAARAGAGALVGVFAFVLLMIVREGMETALVLTTLAREKSSLKMSPSTMRTRSNTPSRIALRAASAAIFGSYSMPIARAPKSRAAAIAMRPSPAPRSATRSFGPVFAARSIAATIASGVPSHITSLPTWPGCGM